MEVVCLETEAFYQLVETVVKRIKAEHNIKEDRWILPEEAMKLLGIKSRTTLQKMRDNGSIRFSQNPDHKAILYDRASIMAYHEKNTKETF